MRSADRVSARSDSGIYFYYRRVPKAVGHLDARQAIRISLGTTDETEAAIKARAIDQEHEALWAALLLGENSKAAFDRYESAVTLAKMFGFTYRPMAQMNSASIEEIVERVLAAKAHRTEPLVVEAILGAAPEPDVRVQDLWKIYKRHRDVEIKGLSPRQYEKHETARKRAMANVESVLGNKPLKDISRGDVLRYRDWWSGRVKAGEVTTDTANRGFSDIKGMISVVDEAVNTDFSAVWRSMNIRKRGSAKQKKRTRPPYPSDWVQKNLLKPGALDRMNKEARLILYAMVETGMRLSEVCNLRSQDIHLRSKIPYVSIQEREDREQKTVYSIRTIPLVGVSLWALKQAPDGFPRYQDKGDGLSAVINKFLKENGLRPTPKHSVYSLRHTFQDRLLAAGAPDRLQTDLMGHEFGRESYGEGASMEQKKELLDRIRFAWDTP